MDWLWLSNCTPKKAFTPAISSSLSLKPPPLLPQTPVADILVIPPPDFLPSLLWIQAGLSRRFLALDTPPIPGILWGGFRTVPLPALVFSRLQQTVALPLINLALHLYSLSSWDHTSLGSVSFPSPPSPCLSAYSCPDTLQLTDTVVTVLFLNLTCWNLRLRF